jgi:hypothetical protein
LKRGRSVILWREGSFAKATPAQGRDGGLDGRNSRSGTLVGTVWRITVHAEGAVWVSYVSGDIDGEVFRIHDGQARLFTTEDGLHMEWRKGNTVRASN